MCPNSKSRKILSRLSLFHFFFEKKEILPRKSWITKSEIPHLGGARGGNLKGLEGWSWTVRPSQGVLVKVLPFRVT